MWVCTKCFNANSSDNVTCKTCHAQRDVPAATPRGRQKHRNADFLSNKKTMYTYASKQHWQRAPPKGDETSEHQSPTASPRGSAGFSEHQSPTASPRGFAGFKSPEEKFKHLGIKDELEKKIGRSRPQSLSAVQESADYKTQITRSRPHSMQLPVPKEETSVPHPSITRTRPQTLSVPKKSTDFKHPVNQKTKIKDNYLIVAALDFGTAYSGYAFSMKGTFDTEPLKIHANQAWNAGGRQLLSLKTPTCLLLDSNKDFVAFGYEAENQYADLVLDEDHHDCFFFRRFKMNLHNNKKITEDMLIEDITGKTIPATTVFTLSIQALVKHLMKLLNQQFIDLRIDELRFVMTVPAIWNDSAKQFMRTCAEQAGIPQDQLLIALEPEAASIYCQYLPTEKLQGSDRDFGMSKLGTKYMVVDLGGGTADITVHEKVSNDHLKELCVATGNDCGGTSVDGRFFQLFVKIAGGPVMKAMQDADPGSYLDLFREFETVKRTINPDKTGKVNMGIPYTALDEQCKSLLEERFPEVLAASVLSNKIALRGDKMRIDADLIKDIFKVTIDEIVSLMEATLASPKTKDVSQLLLVGGFSECMLVQEAVKHAFQAKRVIIPEDPALAVLKGAVLFGHKPTYIESRIMRYTYGVGATDDWNPNEYDEKHRKEIDGVVIADNLFDVIVRKNEMIDVGTAIECEFITSETMQDSLELKVYVSTKEDPKYIDEEGCSFLGAATIHFSEPCAEQRNVKVGFVFGNTELGVTAVDQMTRETVVTNFELI